MHSGKKHGKNETSESTEEHKKCLRCEHIKCVDLYRDINELEGGELHVLNNLINRKIHLPCELGFLLRPICQLTASFSELGFPTFFLYNQCIRDLKASAYLILSSHYRNAIQILRPVLENYLVCLYFDTKWINTKTEKQFTKTEKDFSKFMKEKYEIPYSEWVLIFPKKKRRKKKLDHEFCLKWLVKEGVVNTTFMDRVNKKFGELNKYLHPAFKHMEIHKTDCSACPATVKYNEKEYKEALKLFQDVGTFILDVLCSHISCFLPEKIKQTEDELGYVLTMKDLEKQISHKLIYSDNLNRFISKLIR